MIWHEPKRASMLVFRVTRGSGPASEHEGNLVDEVRDVVDHVEDGIVYGSEQVAEQVAVVRRNHLILVCTDVYYSG